MANPSWIQGIPTKIPPENPEVPTKTHLEIFPESLSGRSVQKICHLYPGTSSEVVKFLREFHEFFQGFVQEILERLNRNYLQQKHPGISTFFPVRRCSYDFIESNPITPDAPSKNTLKIPSLVPPVIIFNFIFQ